MPNNSYNESDAQEILRRAASIQSDGAMSRDELLRAAGELGITPEAVEEAERQYQASRAEEDLRVRFRAKRRSEFYDSIKALLAYGVIGYLLARGDRDWFWIAVVVSVFALFRLIKNASLAFMENTPSWKQGLEEFRAKERRRKGLADRRTSDKVISIILESTPARNKLEVIKNLREQSGMPLNDAKTAVDDYYGRHPEVQSQQS